MIADLLGLFLDLAAPAACAGCGAPPGSKAWCPAGTPGAGLRPWDRTHLCADCFADLAVGPVLAKVAAADLAVWAGARTTAHAARLLAAWKYHGLRGLAWPLGACTAAAARAAAAALPAGAVLVPVPLHGRRRRERGFNQAALLATLVAPRCGWRVRADLVVRRRATGQQARLSDAEGRRANVAGAFVSPSPAGRPRPVVLVDDVVTSGATLAACADALRGAGHPVVGALALATSLADATGCGPVDRPRTRI